MRVCERLSFATNFEEAKFYAVFVSGLYLASSGTKSNAWVSQYNQMAAQKHLPERFRTRDDSSDTNRLACASENLLEYKL